jgi:excisionase family DNA binding protein
MDNLFTIKQVSYILKVHQLTVRRYIREKKLAAVKVGGNVRIKDEDLQKFQKSYSVGAKTHPAKLEEKVKTVFSFDDPLWRLDGISTSLSLPEPDI